MRFTVFVSISILLFSSCQNSVKKKLQGEWHGTWVYHNAGGWAEWEFHGDSLTMIRYPYLDTVKTTFQLKSERINYDNFDDFKLKLFFKEDSLIIYDPNTERYHHDVRLVPGPMVDFQSKYLNSDFIKVEIELPQTNKSVYENSIPGHLFYELYFGPLKHPYDSLLDKTYSMQLNDMLSELEHIRDFVERYDSKHGYRIALFIDKSTPMYFIHLIKAELRKANQFKGLYAIANPESNNLFNGIPYYLPKSPDERQGTSNGPCDLNHMVTIIPLKYCLDLILSRNKIYQNGTEIEFPSLQDSIINFVAKYPQKGFINLGVDDSSTYDQYIHTIAAIFGGYDELRNKEALRRFNKNYQMLYGDEKEQIATLYPRRFSEYSITSFIKHTQTTFN